MHYWSAQNDYWMQEVQPLGRWSVDWKWHSFNQRLECQRMCSLIGGTIIGPYFFDEALTRNVILKFIRNLLELLCKKCTPKIRQPRFCNFQFMCENILNTAYPDRDIKRNFFSLASQDWFWLFYIWIQVSFQILGNMTSKLRRNITRLLYSQY